MKNLKTLFVIASMLFLSSCKLAPFKESGDLFVYLAFWFIGPIIFTIYGVMAWKSGTKTYDDIQRKWIYSDKRKDFLSIAQIQFAIWWLILCTVFFFAFMLPDHGEVWFVK